MGNQFTPITIIPKENVNGNESSAFREVIAYLNGIADTVAAHTDYGRPLSLAPGAGIPQRTPSAAPGSTRVTLRFGELPFDRASVWPQVAVGSPPEPTRGGSRTLDFGFDPARACSLAPTLRRFTLPYEAPSVSLVPRLSSLPQWFEERESEVRLRAGHLPFEWYQLTGTESDSAG
jgi:hypothetical protein